VPVSAPQAALSTPALAGASADAQEALRSGGFYRRLIYMMLFRLVLISLVLGSTLLLWWLSDIDLASHSSVALFILIGTTYLLTVVYALAVRFGYDAHRLGFYQLAGDLLITTVLVHVTGGAQSAFTFFYPLSVIASATLYFRRGAIIVALASLVLLVGICLLGWSELLPMPLGSRILPADQTPLALGRSLGLNVVALIGMSLLASNLGSQLQRTSLHLETQRSATADLITLHRDIVRSLPSGLITLDPRGRILSANRVAAEILDTHESALLGAPLASALPELEPFLGESSGEQSSRPARLEIERSLHGKPQILGVSLAPLFDHRDQALGQVVNFQDLTELRDMEENVKRSERLAMVGELAAGVAHEIRNPLASISGSVELLKSGPEVDGESKTLMDIVIREIDRLNSLITELLDYTNPRPAQMQTMDLVPLCRETMRVFEQDKHFGEVEVRLDAPDTPVEVQGDPEKLRQVLWNLLRNGAEAAAQGGAQVRIQLAARDSAELHVIDNGPGIPPENLDKVVHPFFTTKERGSGLGLASVYGIVEQHGGSISVSSHPGEGAHFTVILPLAKERSATP